MTTNQKTLTLSTVEALSPDQASLNAAKKLLKPAKWVVKNSNNDGNNALVWAHCQGSGANPYKTVIDTSDHGYKCTCPSRKFPCKHSLALMWMYAESNDTANDYPHSDDIPQWISDWLGRRRPATPQKIDADTDTQSTNDHSNKNINSTSPTAVIVDPVEEQKKVAATAKRVLKTRQATDAAITQGMIDYEYWLHDQLRSGLGKFLDDANQNCRKISARLVDAKATTLASRLDELPAKLLNAHKDMRMRVATNELSKTVWLIKAWQKHYTLDNIATTREDPLYKNLGYIDVRRAINSFENREKLLDNPDKIEKVGLWQVVAEHIETRKDGLISHATWLMYKGCRNITTVEKNTEDTESIKSTETKSAEETKISQKQKGKAHEPQFALLQDYYPIATGRREGVSRIGEIMEATAIFYPSAYPLRAILTQQKTILMPLQMSDTNPHDDEDKGFDTTLMQAISNQPQTMAEFIHHYQQVLAVAPWLEAVPICLPKGRFIANTNQNHSKNSKKTTESESLQHIWWQSADNAHNPDNSWQLPLSPNQSLSDSEWALLLASELEYSIVFWDGVYARYGSSQTAWGML